jgi:4-hydroxy-2-oxoglutarate aldolase
MNRQALTGVFPPMLTPFTERGDVDYDAHSYNISRWNSEELGGVVVLGSNSETPYLSEDEKVGLIALTVKAVKFGRTVIAGTGCESTQETIRLTVRAAGEGVHAVLVLTPFYYGGRMNDDALIRHYQRVADASPVPVLIYNVPAYSHLNISVNAIRTLASHPNIAGMKDSTTDIGRFSQISAVVPPSFTLMTGSAALWYAALPMGVEGGILALGKIAGTACSRIRTLYAGGKHDEARNLYLKLLPVNAAITLQYSVPGLKCAADLLGYKGCHLRSPLLPLAGAEREDVRLRLVAAGLLDPS